MTTRQHQPQRQCCRQLEELLLVQNSSKPTVLTVGDFLTRTVRPKGHNGRSRHCKLQKCHHRDLAAALHHPTPSYLLISRVHTETANPVGQFCVARPRCTAARMGDSILGGFHLHLGNPKSAVPSTVDAWTNFLLFPVIPMADHFQPAA